jgi:hypothetical protein
MSFLSRADKFGGIQAKGYPDISNLALLNNHNLFPLSMRSMNELTAIAR